MSNPHPLRDLKRTVLAHFWFKTFGTSGFTTLFFVAYIYLLRHPASPVTIMPVTWLDGAIGFQPAALPVYLSLWLYVSLPPVLMQTRREITQYGVRIGALCLAGLALFYLWPNAVPAAQIDWSRYPGVALLKGVDAAGNACPSLHVATSVFSAIWFHYRFRHLGYGRAVQLANILWCVAIAYSTLATKQHVAVDVLAGTVLAFIMAWLTRLQAHAELQSGQGPVQPVTA